MEHDIMGVMICICIHGSTYQKGKEILAEKITAAQMVAIIVSTPILPQFFPKELHFPLSQKI